MMTPALVALRNCETPEEPPLDAARAETRRLQAWARWVDPLLRSLEGGAAVSQRLAANLAAQARALDHDLELLEVASDEAAAALLDARSMLDALPRHSRTPLVNEVLVIGTAMLQGQDSGGLRARLPHLWRWLEDLEHLEDRPLEGLREALGGLAVFLEEGRREDLARALALLEHHSRGPVLLRDPGEERAAVAEEVVERIRFARARSFLPLRDHRARVEPLEAIFARLTARLEQGDLEGCRRELPACDRLLAELESVFENRPGLEEAPSFAFLVRLMSHVYHGTAPRDWLGQLVDALEAGLYDLASESPPAAIEQLLMQQRNALDTVRDFLEHGDRRRLLRAYEELCSPTLALAASRIEGLDVFDTGETYDELASTAGGTAPSFAAIVSMLERHGEGRLETESVLDALEPFAQTLGQVEQELAREDLAAAGQELGLLARYTRETLEDVVESLEGRRSVEGVQTELLELGRHLQGLRERLSPA